MKKNFVVFLSVLCVLGFEVDKKCYYDPKNIFFSHHFDMDVKNAEFDADFKSNEKSVKKSYKKRY